MEAAAGKGERRTRVQSEHHPVWMPHHGTSSQTADGKLWSVELFAGLDGAAAEVSDLTAPSRKTEDRHRGQDPTIEQHEPNHGTDEIFWGSLDLESIERSCQCIDSRQRCETDMELPVMNGFFRKRNILRASAKPPNVRHGDPIRYGLKHGRRVPSQAPKNVR